MILPFQLALLYVNKIAMCLYPIQQFLISYDARGKCKNLVRQFFLRVFQLDAVDCQKNQHRHSSYTLVAVYEGMVHHQSIAKPCRFLLNSWIEFWTAEALIRLSQSWIKQSFVPKTKGPPVSSIQRWWITKICSLVNIFIWQAPSRLPCSFASVAPLQPWPLHQRQQLLFPPAYIQLGHT